MSEPQVYNLDSKGREWTRKSLEMGGILSREVQSINDLKMGETSVVLCTWEQEMAVSKKSIEHGTIQSRLINSEPAAEAILKIVTHMEKERGQLAVVVEDDLMRPGDPATRDDETALYTLGRTVIHCRWLDELKTAKNLDHYLAQSASGYPLNAFLVPIADLPAKGELDEKDIKKVANSVRGIINTAFDRESYTIWIPIK